jgi:hypothetical protein
LQSRYQQLYEEFTRLYPALRQTGIWHPNGR